MGIRLYRLLIRLMPEGFRAEYGEEMCRVAEEQWREHAPYQNRSGAALFWARQSMAVLRAAAGLHRHEHGMTGGMTMTGFAHDLRQAVRALARRPGFSLLTVLTLALGIGATTAIFSAVHTVVLRPLPYTAAEDVVVLFRTDAVTGERGEGVAASNVRDLREQATLLDQLAVAEPWSLDLQADGRVESLRTWAVSRGFFDAIGAQALLGRTFTDADYDEGGSALVIMSHRAWVGRFSSDPGVLGQPLTLDGAALTVVGVMPPEFRFPDAAEMWIPRVEQPWDESARAADFMTGVARLREGTTLEQAQAETARIATGMRETHPEVNGDLAYALVPLREHLFGDVRTPLFVIMVAVGFVLLIACANVAGLMLARGAQRERDYALRGALGAGSGRLVGHVIAESLILALIGSVVGGLIAWSGVALIRWLGPTHLPRIDELKIDGTVMAFAAAVSALSAVLSSLAPSLRLSRPDLRNVLSDGSRGVSGGRQKGRARSRLVVAQVAAAVVLLAGAGLLMRSFGVLLDKELGFDPSERLAVQIFAYDYASNADRQAVIDQAMENMRALPGVRNVAVGSDIPGATDGAIAKIETTLPFTIADQAAPPAGQEPVAAYIAVSPGYFDVLAIDVVAGRGFTRADDPAGTPVLIINQALARRHFGSRSPLGEALLIQRGNAAPVPREIVGVVADTRPLGHASEPSPEMFTSLAQAPSGSLTFVVEAETEAAALTMPIMEAIWEANPAQSVYGTSTVDALVAEWLQERRFNLFLLGAFSFIALTLSAIGLYGLISFSVERRLGELGIRRALGGRSLSLMGMVLGEGARLAGTGLAIGLLAAWYLSRFMQSMLFEIEPTDPMTLGGLATLVLLIALLATLVPALRAMRVDPAEALRSE